MKIAMLDLSHATLGVTTNTTPLASGVIAQYLKATIDSTFDIRYFKDIHEALNTNDKWTPDLITLSQYCWNSQLNLYAAEVLKRKSHAVVVAGGPNLELEDSLKHRFLAQHGHIVDLCVEFDGEIPLSNIIARLLKGESIEDIRSTPSCGTYSLHPRTGELTQMDGPPPRLNDLNGFGSLYAEGSFDKFLDQGYFPMLQTHRGCPFHCMYCHTGGNYYDTVIFQSPDVFKRDIEYLARRFAGKTNIPLFLANANMGLFSQDFKIASIIRDMQDKYEWPKILDVNSGKNPKKLMKMLSIIDFSPSIAMQTLTPHVLKKIHRINLPLDKYMEFQKSVQTRRGYASATELIMSLPGETTKSFEDTIYKIVDSGVQNICIYTLMRLKGTSLALNEIAQAYGHDIRYRVVPRCFTKIGDELILEPEEVIVGTNELPFHDYLYLRGLVAVINIFASSLELFPLRRLITDLGMSVSQWIKAIHKKLHGNTFFSVYDDYCTETEAELYASPESMRSFFSKSENYRDLSDGRLGDNLTRKYKFIALYHNFQTCLDISIDCLQAISEQSGKDMSFVTPMLKDLKTFLATRDLKQAYSGLTSETSHLAELMYDVPGWLESIDSGGTLMEHAQPRRYQISVPDQTRKQFEDSASAFKDFELSMQILYRDCITEKFWPHWQPIKS